MKTKSRYYYLLCSLVILLAGSIYQEALSQSADQNYIRSRVMTTSDASKYIETVQYFDGLGRPNQQVATKATPSGYDLVSLQEYDNMGRESFSWLPGKANQSNGYYVPDATVKANSQTTNTGDARSFTEPVYEPSPLNRVNQVYGPGSAWKTAGRAVKTEYLSNSATDAQTSCVMFRMANTYHFEKKGKYPAGSLYVTKTTDEDNNVLYEFKDKFGLVVLQRNITTAGNHDTYYVYDDRKNLRFVFPPTLADHYSVQPDQVFNIWEFSKNDIDMLYKYGYLYDYDQRNRCFYKKTPTAGHTSLTYDRSDRMIFSQDGQQQGKEWTFYKYDALGRLVLSGIKADATDYYVQRVNNQDKLFVETYSASGPIYRYSNSNYLVNVGDVHTVNYYDNYSWIDQFSVADQTALKYAARTGSGVQHSSAQGLLTGTRRKLLDTSGKEIITAYYYDVDGRLIQSLSKNQSGGYDKTYFAYNFDGSVKMKLMENTVPGKNAITELYTYDYDNMGRLTKKTYKLNAETPVVMAEYAYNDLGQLSQKKLAAGKTYNNYTYNIRGWLQKNAGDKFSQDLFYNDAAETAGTGRFNGNISATKSFIVGDAAVKGYNFAYDQLDRMTAAVYGEGANLSSVKDRYSEKITYDKMGNILTLQRWGKWGDSGGYGLIDNIKVDKYTGHQISHVDDPSGSVNQANVMDFAVGPFSTWSKMYNNNGCVTADANKRLCDIQYNFLNLPKRVQHQDGHVAEYIYDASGVKRTTRHLTSRSVLNLGWFVKRELAANEILDTIRTDYYDNKVYQNGTIKMILTDEGYVAWQNNAFKHYYYLKDHLGNNRVVMDAAGTIAQKNYYYPFGMTTWESVSQPAQPYKFNGKELDRMYGLDWFDYSARLYDGALGRFWSPDPMCEKYYSISPYAYCNNNPINRVDPDGMNDYYLNEDGRVVLARRTDDNHDNLYGKDGNSIRVNDQGLLSQLKISSGYENQATSETANSGDAFNVFKFASDNSSAEWAVAGYKNGDGKTDYILNTSFDEGKVTTKSLGREKSDMIFHIHSHPGGDDTKIASGYYDGLNYIDGDGKFMAVYYNEAKAANKKFPSEFPRLYFYHKESKELYNYNCYTNSEFVGNAKTPLKLRNLVNNHKIKIK